MAIIGLPLFPNLDRIINSVVMKSVGPHLAEHVVTIVPHRTKSQNLSVQVYELLQLVESGRCDVSVLGLLAGQGVGVRGARLRGVQHDTLAAHEIFCVVVAVVDVERFTVEDHVVSHVQIFPQPVFS